jgi:hypothetical protein
MDKQVNIVATLYVFVSIFFLLVAALIVLSLMGIAGAVGEQLLTMVSRFIALAAGIFLSLLALAGFVVALGLFARHQWARWLTIILSVINLFNVPLGTLLGIYALWVLLHPRTVELFKNL